MRRSLGAPCDIGIAVSRFGRDDGRFLDPDDQLIFPKLANDRRHHGPLVIPVKAEAVPGALEDGVGRMIPGAELSDSLEQIILPASALHERSEFAEPPLR